ncbi:ATP-dependent Clp protease ATP-binding subunit ClpX [Myxococcota bacterium]|nr:ATP-dependent Clp protease ATP-binding subunit ClpX [Myxococcota bacterium]
MKDIAPHRRVHFPASSEARSIQPFIAQDADNHPLTLRSLTPDDGPPLHPSPSQPIHAEPTPPSQPIHAEPTPPSQPIHAEPTPLSQPMHAEPTPLSQPIHEEPTPLSQPIHEEPTPLSQPIHEEPSSSVRSAPPLPKRPCGYAPTPRAIKEFLDRYVIAQEQAKKKLAVAVYSHYHRVEYMQKRPAYGVELHKSNVLLIGPSGTGKTLLAQSLARSLHVPFAMADATSLTEAGYVGQDVEQMLTRLYQAAEGDKQRTERGILYIDEIDKIARKPSASATRDISGEGVQQSLLKLLEGTSAILPGTRGRSQSGDEGVQIDTSNILFICGGAFVGIEEIIARRLAGQEQAIGDLLASVVSTDDLLRQVLPEDLVRYGMLPELIGRLPVCATLDPLDHAALVRILTEPKNSLVAQYKQMLSFEGVQLVFEPAALDAIAEKALRQKVGARGLRMILEELMLDILYEIPSREGIRTLTLTRDIVEGHHPTSALWITPI